MRAAGKSCGDPELPHACTNVVEAKFSGSPSVSSRNRSQRFLATNATSVSTIVDKTALSDGPSSQAPTGPAKLATANFRE
jgi:hypothetical protein